MKLKDYMLLKSLSFRDMAKLCGVSVSSIFMAAKNNKMPGKHVLRCVQNRTRGMVTDKDFD